MLKATSGINRGKTIAAYGPGAIQSVLDSSSQLFAIQVVGAATSIDQLKYLCRVFPSFSSRLKSADFNAALIQKTICNASSGKAIPSPDEIKTFTAEISTEIWIIQAIGAVESEWGVKKLSQLINGSAASRIGLVGSLAKKDVCAAADVTHKVSRSHQPAQFNLTTLLENSFAPVSKVVLPFVPIKEVIVSPHTKPAENFEKWEPLSQIREEMVGGFKIPPTGPSRPHHSSWEFLPTCILGGSTFGSHQSSFRRLTEN